MVSVEQTDFKSLLTTLDRDNKASIYLPDDEEYTKLNIRFSDKAIKKAGAIFLPNTAEEVSAAIKFVNEHNIDLAVVCGGHSCAGASSTEGGLVIDLRLMKTVTVDTEKKTITCGGGCQWKEVYEAAAKHDLVVVGGTIDKVGIGGLTLGGGFSYISGKYGLVIDNLLSVEMVLASGEIVTASNDANQDLFWAIRGAGANFGIATKFTYQAHDQKNKVFAGSLSFEPTLSNITTIIGFLNSYFSSEEDDGRILVFLSILCPPPDYNKPIVCLIIVYNGPKEEALQFMKPLYDLKPIDDQMAEMPYHESNSMLTEIDQNGGRKFFKGFTFKLPLQVSTFMDSFEAYKKFIKKYSHDPKINITAIFFDYMSYKKIASLKNGCFANRGEYLNGTVLAQWSLEENDDDIMAWSRQRSKEITHKNGVVMEDGREPFYPNYDDIETPPQFTFGDSYPRLVEFKTKYDSKNIFNKWHPIVPENPAGI